MTPRSAAFGSTFQRMMSKCCCVFGGCLPPPFAWLAKIHLSHTPIIDSVAVIAVVIPSEDEIGANSAIESWHVEQVHKLMTMKDQHGAFPRQLPDEPPSEVAQAISTFLQGAHGEHPNVQVTITATPISDPTSFDHQYATKFFTPTVINYIAHSTNMKRQRHRPEEDNMEGYGICLFNMGDQKQMQVIYDMVLLSEAMGEDDDFEERHQLEKDAHLTPLENTLEKSISAANSVLREMKYMEKREQRMRQTAEAINTRVRWFSYFSVAVLLGVTYIQVSYLKRYFKKKKLM